MSDPTIAEPRKLPPGISLRRTIPASSAGSQRVALAWSCDGQRLAATGPDGYEVWQFDETGRHLLPEVIRHGGERISQIAWSPVDPAAFVHSGSKRIAMVRLLPDGSTTVWEKAVFQPVASYGAGISFSPTGSSVVVVIGNSQVRILDASDGHVVKIVPGERDAASVAWASAGDQILIAGRRGMPRLVHAFSDKEVLAGPAGEVNWVTWSPDGKWACLADQALIRVIDKTGSPRANLEGHTDSLLSVEFSHDSRLLYSVSMDGTIRCWYTASWQCVAVIPTGDSHHTTGGLAAAPNQPLLARRTQDRRRIEIYEVDVDQLIGAARRPSRFYANAKVVLLGDSGVGKSGLSLVLTDRAYAPTDSTHAREVRTFDDHVVDLPDGGLERRETLLWDLAGQPGYRLIHQLHLAEVAAALIVFDARSETDPFAGVRYWARALRQHTAAGPNRVVPAFLVAARADRGGIPVTKDRVDDLCAELGLTDSFVTSAKEGRQIAELAEAVRQAIDWTTLPRSVSTEFFDKIKQFLRDERDSEQVLATVDDLYRRFIRQHPHQSAELELRAAFGTCVRLLELRDLVRRLSFGDFVLLRPELLDSYASALIDAARSQPDGLGFLAEETALAGDFPIPIEHRLPGAAQRLLLIATVEELLRHDVALREPTDGGVDLVFPSQLTADRPEQSGPDMAEVVFRFEGAVQTIYAILAVRLAHVSAYRRERMWRNACTYRALAGGLCGLRVGEIEEGHGELTLFFDREASEETRFVFEEYVRAHLETRAVPSTVERVRVFACPQCGYRLPGDLVRRRQERGDPDMGCPDCERARVSLLDRRERLDQAARVRDMNASADTGRDRAAATATIRGKEETQDFDVFLSYNSKDRDVVLKIAARLRAVGLLPWFDSSDLPPGRRWQEELEQQIGLARSVAIFIGSHGLGPWQKLEQEAFLQEHTRRADFRIVPVLLPDASPDVDLPRFLGLLNAVDFRILQPDPFDRLRWAIAGERPPDVD